jgi:Fe-S cluster biogenesis protein NfuA
VATTARPADLEQRLQEIDALVERVESSPDATLRDAARELLQVVMELHRAALERVLSALSHGGALGPHLMEEIGRDEVVQCVLLLHDLHPKDVRTRVQEALEQARPFLRSHGGDVELVGIDGGETARLRLKGSCHGCPSSSVTLKLAVEHAIRAAAPDIAAIVLVDADAPVPPRDVTFTECVPLPADRHARALPLAPS